MANTTSNEAKTKKDSKAINNFVAEHFVDIFDNLNIKEKINNAEEKNVKTVDEITKKWSMNDKIVQLFDNRMKADNILRKNYSLALIIILSFQLVALTTVFVFKGLNILEYTDATFNIFISAGIAEVYVLVQIIIKYLFKDNLTPLLNVILENNNEKNKSNGKGLIKNIKNEMTGDTVKNNL